MFPYPSGKGLHVGHPLGYIGTDVMGRYLRMTGRNVLHTIGYDAFGLPAEQYAVRTGTHPPITTEENIERYRAQLRRLGFAHDQRRSVATTDPEFFRWTQWIFTQLFEAWYDDRPAAGPADRRAGRRVRRRGPAGAGRPAVGRPDPRSSSTAAGPAPAGLHRRGPGELVPRSGHGAVQRGGHPRRSQRDRQLPGLQAHSAAVDDADHRLRRPADRRPGPAGLAGVGQVHAAQLDRPLERRPGPVRRGRRRGRRPAESDESIEVYTTRPDTLFGATYMVLAPEHPLVDAIVADAWPAGTDPRWTGGAATPAEAVAAYRRERRRQVRPGPAGEQGEDRRLHSARRRSTRPTAARCRSSSRTTC